MNARLPLLAQVPVPDSEAVLARLFEVSPEPVTVTELETGCLLSVNPAFAELTGYAAHELVGRRAIDLGLWEDPRLRERYICRLRAEGRVDDFTAVFVSTQG